LLQRSTDVARKESLGASLGALSSNMDIGHSSGPFVAGGIVSSILFAVFAFRKG
jgi:hypothetical protein